MANSFVKDVMKEKIISMDVNKSILNAAEIMTSLNVGCVIVTRENKPVGILTERDFVRKIVSKKMDIDDKLLSVMSSPLITINQDDLIWEAAEIMKQKNIHKLPVIDGEKLVGIVTTTDLVAICSIGSDSSMRKICDEIILRMEKDYKS